MKSKLVRNLQAGFGLSLLLLVAVSVASYISIHNLLESARRVDHSKLVISKLEYVLSTMKDAETGQRGYLLTANDEFLLPYTGSQKKALYTIDEFKRLTADNPQQQANADNIKTIIQNRLGTLQIVLEKKKAGGAIVAEDLLAGKNAMDELRQAVRRAEADENKLLDQRIATLSDFVSLTPAFIILSTLGAIGITIFSYARVMGGISERARLYTALEARERETAAMNEELAAANEEMNAANEELGAFNEELNAANEELASANEEILAAQENVNDLNEKLGASNEELAATVDELYQSQQNLRLLNDELEDRVKSRTRELSESEARFRVMMNSIPQMAWTSNPAGEVTYFNRKWYEFTGLNEEQSLGWGWGSVIHPDDIANGVEIYNGILQKGEAGEFELRKRSSAGNYRWFLARMQPVKNEHDGIRLWVGTATDIDDLKNLQQQKDDFISIASHELKTPVTSLKVSLQLLDRIKSDPSAPTFAKLIAQANKSLDKVSVLIEDLLNVSRLNQGQLQLNKTWFNVKKLIENCCQHILLEGVYSINIGGDREADVLADEERIEQVITNFVNNAIKYAPESKVIQALITKENDMVKVAITDKGPGIPPEKVEHLFERYFRVDTSGQQYSGLGLGLYISSEIIKRHGGRIGVDTEIGKGSTFWFTIPISG